jgi:putative transposase
MRSGEPGCLLEWVNEAESPAELEALRTSVNRGQPYDSDGWVERTAKRLGLQKTLRPRGRPRKKREKGS